MNEHLQTILIILAGFGIGVGAAAFGRRKPKPRLSASPSHPALPERASHATPLDVLDKLADTRAILDKERARRRFLADKVGPDVQTLRGQLEVAERKNREYFALIESVLKQRDDRWKMFLEQSAGHIQAQAMYERALGRERQLLYRAVRELNRMREQAGMPLVEKPEELVKLDDPPIGLAQKFADEVETVKKEMDAPIDGAAERDRIAQS